MWLGPLLPQLWRFVLFLIFLFSNFTNKHTKIQRNKQNYHKVVYWVAPQLKRGDWIQDPSKDKWASTLVLWPYLLIFISSCLSSLMTHIIRRKKNSPFAPSHFLSFPSLVLFGFVWPIWAHLDPFGPFWTHLDLFGPVRTHVALLALFGLVWIKYVGTKYVSIYNVSSCIQIDIEILLIVFKDRLEMFKIFT